MTTHEHDVRLLVEYIKSGQLSAERVAEQYLDRIKNDQHNSVLFVDRDRVLEDARAIDAKRARGEALGALAGVPVGIKDVLCTRGEPTTCGSKILENYRPPYDAHAIERLRQADALIIAKLNMDEFAMGSSNENSAYGPVNNPVNPSRVPGGSSGASAAAVASGLALATLGSDTGGSIRQPASFCGVVGIKPTYGRVSRYGLIAYASSLDQVGPFARDVRGTARVLEVISGHDPRDSTSVKRDVPSFGAACDAPLQANGRKLRVGVPREYFADVDGGFDDDVRQSIEKSLEFLRDLGCDLVPISMPHTKYVVPTYYVLATAEASSNLARFDGVRYGVRAGQESRNLATMYGATRDQGFGKEVKKRILLGTFVLSAGYYDAYYTKAQKVRTLLRRDFEHAFNDVDVIVGPTSPLVAWPLGSNVDDPLKAYLADIFTLPASLAGLPGISVPTLPATSNAHAGLPIGLQIVAPAWCEERLFTLAAAFEAHVAPMMTSAK